MGTTITTITEPTARKPRLASASRGIRSLATFALSLALVGCTATEPLAAIPDEHPASEKAAEAAVLSPPNILAPAAATDTPSPPSTSPHHHKPGEASDAPAKTYTCPMHPDVRLPAPGRCPRCGMTLVPVETQGEHR